MSISRSGSNQNVINNTNTIGSNNDYNKRIFSSRTAERLLKILFENEGYQFTSFSSKDHAESIKQITQLSEEQDNQESLTSYDDSVLNEFINSFYRTFSNSFFNSGMETTVQEGMVKYEIYSVQSLNCTRNDNQFKSIWLPKSMIISDAQRIFSTKLYSNDNTVPVDLADYVLVYENIMISLEVHHKELYEEILKISFRLNRVALPPFRLLVIHKSHLILLERKESKPLLREKESISVLQLILFHLIPNNIEQLTSEDISHTIIANISSIYKNEYWPFIELKMGIIPSSRLSHPLKHDKLRKTITSILRANGLSGDIKTNADICIKLLEQIFLEGHGDLSYIKSITPSLLKSVEVYDYPLLIALPYDRLLLSQFCKIQCSDHRWAQGVMANGKYYSIINNPYIPMSELKINRGSIIHLRFNLQADTITNGNISIECNKMTYYECYEEATGDSCSVYGDDRTVQIIFPSQVIDSLMRTADITLNNTRITYLRSHLKASNNWTDPSMNIDRSIISSMYPLLTEDRPEREFIRNNYLTNRLTHDYGPVTLTNNASTSSLPPIDRPECLNCLSELNDDNLECPQCTQVFCRECIESSYDDFSRNPCCPKCHHEVNLLEYRKSAIIGKFEREGTSVFKCLHCKSIPNPHRLCRDPECAALFCYKCCKQSLELPSSATSQGVSSTGTIKCPRCKVADTYVSCAVLHYVLRITEYQTAQEIESDDRLSSNPSFPNTIWKQENWTSEIGTLKENENRVISVIQFDGEHIQFDNRQNNCPRLIIYEPCEYACPESLQLSYWNADPEKHCWENDKNVQFQRHGQDSIAADLPHFSMFTVRSTRLIEYIMLDKAFLNITYDYDFTTTDDTGKTFHRGLERYIRPCGWYRIAITVLGKFENNMWLGEGRDAWPVAYHGTSTDNALPILRNGLLAGGSNGIHRCHGACHGSGIYLSPDPLFSGAKLYARPLIMDGRQYQVMFQVRIKPDSIRKTRFENIWTCDNSRDVRPYGILYREI